MVCLFTVRSLSCGRYFSITALLNGLIKMWFEEDPSPNT